MSVTLPALPYVLDALEPHLSRHTLTADLKNRSSQAAMIIAQNSVLSQIRSVDVETVAARV